MFWRGVAGRLQCFGGVLVVFWRGMALWKSLAVFWRGACSVLEGRLQCFGGACGGGTEGHGKITVFYMRLPVICSHKI